MIVAAPASAAQGVRGLWTVALACGLLAGLGEGVVFRWCEQNDYESWPSLLATGPETLWFSPVVSAVLLLLVGAGIAILQRVRRSLKVVAWMAGAGVAWITFDWLRAGPFASRLTACTSAVALGSLAVWCALRRQPTIVRLARGVAVVALIATLTAVAATNGLDAWRERRALVGVAPPPPGARSVLVLVWDTVRSDHLSAYGYRRATSPNLAKLAAGGARFDAAFSTSSWTLPAHASMLTGRSAYAHGAELSPLDATSATLGEVLGDAGYRTAAFSGNLCYFTRRFGFGRGFHRFEDVNWSFNGHLLRTLPGREINLLARASSGRKVDLVCKIATDVVDGFLGWLDAATPTPYFAFLNFFDAHAPYRPPPNFKSRFAGDGMVVTTAKTQPADANPRAADPAALATDMQAYDESIAWCDAELGRLLAELDRRGRLDDTLIVVTSDHGEAFGERGELLHRGSLHREQVEVPLVMSAPGLIVPGTIVPEVASIAALPATIVELLSREKCDRFTTPSLVPWLIHSAAFDARVPEDAEGTPPAALLELAHHPWPEYRRRPCFHGAEQSLIVDRWHLIRHDAFGDLLFDRVADPREEHDLLAERFDVAVALRARLAVELARDTCHPNSGQLAETLVGSRSLGGIGYVSSSE